MPRMVAKLNELTRQTEKHHEEISRVYSDGLIDGLSSKLLGLEKLMQSLGHHLPQNKVGAGPAAALQRCTEIACPLR